MPLSEIQLEVASLLAKNRSPDSYLAGGAAMHMAPQSKRYSNHLDYFHDSEERVASAFASDRSTLEAAGFTLTILVTQPGFISATVTRNSSGTKADHSGIGPRRTLRLRPRPSHIPVGVRDLRLSADSNE